VFGLFNLLSLVTLRSSLTFGTQIAHSNLTYSLKLHMHAQCAIEVNCVNRKTREKISSRSRIEWRAFKPVFVSFLKRTKYTMEAENLGPAAAIGLTNCMYERQSMHSAQKRFSCTALTLACFYI